jgi:hypothetical protein
VRRRTEFPAECYNPAVSDALPPRRLCERSRPSVGGCAFEGVSLFLLSPDFLIEEERRVYDLTGLLIQLGVLRVRVVR